MIQGLGHVYLNGRKSVIEYFDTVPSRLLIFNFSKQLFQ
jgi:hypothetical protein